MNDALIEQFIRDAAAAPAGKRMHALIAMVAERCATICDIEADSEPANSGAAHASRTIRAAFIGAPPQLKPAARAEAAHALQMATKH